MIIFFGVSIIKKISLKTVKKLKLKIMWKGFLTSEGKNLKLEKNKKLIFKSTKFGDDNDRAYKKMMVLGHILLMMSLIIMIKF